MTCLYCDAPLKGFADARVVIVQGHKYIACLDLDACEQRVAAQERTARGAGASDIFAPRGD